MRILVEDISEWYVSLSPREPDDLKYLLRAHINAGGHNLHRHLKEVYVRPFVLLLLLDFLIDRNHEVFRGKGSVALLKERMREAVAKHYPEEEGHLPEEEREGRMPESIRTILEEQHAEAVERAEEKEKSFEGLPKFKRRRMFPEKNATPGEKARAITQCFADLRPNAVCLDKSAKACSDPATLREGAIERFGEVHVQTGGKAIPQWESKYFSQILPFVVPRMVSGPDYYPDRRWRRTSEDAPFVSVQAFTSGFARRVEASCRTDFVALPIIRSVAWKHTAEHTMVSAGSFYGKRDSATETSAAEYIRAAQNVAHHLHHGFTGTGVHRMPIAGDTTRLPFATGLTPLERKLARDQHFLAQNLGGSQQLRQLMGHTQFGARVNYGDCVFFTISPNEQHSALVLRLSRFRANDPYVKHQGEAERQLAGQNVPTLEARPRQTENVEQVDVELPEYDMRRIATARDPLAVVEAYRIHVLLRLAAVLGVRMCPRCPRCNHRGRLGCQDKFGSNMRPMGGVLGGMCALGGATEHQGMGTPHFHAEGHVVCAYQYDTLHDIAEKLREGHFTLEALKTYNAWLHSEDVVDEKMHTEFLGRVYKEWEDRFSSPEHNGLSTTPTYLLEEAAYVDAPTIVDAKGEAAMTELRADGKKFLREYTQDVQYVFSRVQHHVHKPTKQGFMPLKACRSKHTKKTNFCKADFPKHHLCTEKPLLICRGLARRFALKTSGRRNSFGCILGKRRCGWQSGTARSLAVVFRSNTHTFPNYRAPVIPETHEVGECKSKKCAEHVAQHSDTKTISKLAQRAQREATGYFCGYTFKKQPVGRRFLRGAAESLNYLTASMEGKTDGQRWHRITHRILTDFQHRCMTRTAPEEWNLAANWHEKDARNAEFLRTYMSIQFPGGQLVRRLRAEEEHERQREVRKVLPKKKLGEHSNDPVKLHHFEDSYGFRGNNRNVYYLSPWEFLMLWEVLPLPKPGPRTEEGSRGDAEKTTPSEVPLTLPVEQPPSDNADDTAQYDVNPAAESDDVLFFPELPVGPQLRRHWYMRRRHRPMVPAPTSTPMPDKEVDQEGKARLFSLYMRPWVLDHRFASSRVPHLCNLKKLPTSAVQQVEEPESKRRRLRGKQAAPHRDGTMDGDAHDSYASAWRWYVRGHVVSLHAKRLIVQWMAACCGKSTRGNDEDDMRVQEKLKEVPDNTLFLSRVHGILERMSKNEASAKATTEAQMSSTGETTVADDAGDVDRKALEQSSQIRDSMQLTAELWSMNQKAWPEEVVDTRISSLSAPPSAGNKTQKPRPLSKKDPKCRLPQLKAYIEMKEAKIKEWWDSVRASDEPPTPEQEAFLVRVVQRCREEHRELQAAGSKGLERPQLSEPVRDCLFGIPGSGKSTCIKLVRRFFEECLCWEDGVQFQFLASQNTMAAIIGGATVHTWGVIPVNLTDAVNKSSSKGKDGDVDELFLNALGIRWIIIDEASTLSPTLLGTLDAYLRRACTRHPYARRGQHHRPFGGLNIVFSGDLWQLPPVRAVSLFSNPFKANTYTFEEQKIFKMFWSKGEDSIQKTFVLTQSKRAKDPWLKAVLEADRYGKESWEIYCYSHGLPTRHTGSWIPGEVGPACGNARCRDLVDNVWPQLWRRGRGRDWAFRAGQECDICKAERRRRCCVRNPEASDDSRTRHLEEPFTDAPFVHPFRYPSYHAQQLRAINFAKAKNRRLLWITAHDELKTRDAAVSKDKEVLRKERWLEFNDRKTSGIPGLFPLILDLPVRFTETPDAQARAMGAFRNARGWIRGWELTPKEQERLERVEERETVLIQRPRRLFIEVETATTESMGKPSTH